MTFPPEKKKRIFLLPNVITAFGLSCGLFVIFKMTMTGIGEVTPHLLTSVAGILLLAAFADILDGAVARVMKAESDFGGLFDSLADAITFGVGPSVIVLKSLSLPSGTEHSFLITTAAIIFSVCGVLRLVRFNILANQAKSDDQLLYESKKNFTGLPIPAAATAAVSANLFLISNELRTFVTLSDTAHFWSLFAILIFLGYLMICRWKFPSLKRLNIRVASFQLVLFTVLTAVLVVYGLLNHFAVVFFTVTWFYILLALSLSLARLLTGKKSKTLEDFEPEPEEEMED
jgi:CDP-diacylglycerol--serine O-phosphatidyltransferase